MLAFVVVLPASALANDRQMCRQFRLGHVGYTEAITSFINSFASANTTTIQEAFDDVEIVWGQYRNRIRSSRPSTSRGRTAKARILRMLTAFNNYHGYFGRAMIYFQNGADGAVSEASAGFAEITGETVRALPTLTRACPSVRIPGLT